MFSGFYKCFKAANDICIRYYEKGIPCKQANSSESILIVLLYISYIGQLYDFYFFLQRCLY